MAQSAITWLYEARRIKTCGISISEIVSGVNFDGVQYSYYFKTVPGFVGDLFGSIESAI